MPATYSGTPGCVTASDAPGDQADEAQLSRFERLAVKVAREMNERPLGKALQTAWLRGVSYGWVRPAIGRRVLVEGLADLFELHPEKGVLFTSNHRSFFDQYVILLSVFGARVPWFERLYFPVRANFFYENPLGMFVNYFVAGGAMYPPIFRQKERRELNDQALDKMVELLGRPGNVLGMHPEGTRGKGDDPYTFLPAQPGVGKVALLGKPMVVPAFIHGLGNNVVEDIKWNFGSEARKSHAVVTVFGPPVDYSDLLAEKPRPTLYKKAADRFMAEIKKLMVREKEIRAEIDANQMSDDDPRWLGNLPVNKLYAREGQL